MCGYGETAESSSFANQIKRDMMNAAHIDHSQSPAFLGKIVEKNLQQE